MKGSKSYMWPSMLTIYRENGVIQGPKSGISMQFWLKASGWKILSNREMTLEKYLMQFWMHWQRSPIKRMSIIWLFIRSCMLILCTTSSHWKLQLCWLIGQKMLWISYIVWGLLSGQLMRLTLGTRRTILWKKINSRKKSCQLFIPFFHLL